jgi:hypothetical protein
MGQKERVLSLEHEGRVYNLSARDFNGVDDLEMHRAIGFTLAQVFFGGKVTLFTIAALVWRYRVNNGEPDLTYLDVAKTFTFDDITTVSDEPRGDADPKASGTS